MVTGSAGAGVAVRGRAHRPQAAEALRARIDFKNALGLELGDSSFDFWVLSQFRDRRGGADAGQRVLDGILTADWEKNLLEAGWEAPTDSPHVL